MLRLTSGFFLLKLLDFFRLSLRVPISRAVTFLLHIPFGCNKGEEKEGEQEKEGGGQQGIASSVLPSSIPVSAVVPVSVMVICRACSSGEDTFEYNNNSTRCN